MEIDWSVGEVMKTLKECGLEEETLVKEARADLGANRRQAGTVTGK